MQLQGSSNKNVSRNTKTSTDNIENIKIKEINNIISNGLSIINNIPIENYDLDEPELSNEGKLNKDSINFSRIATSAANVNSGKFITIKNTKYWGDKGELTYKVRKDGTVAIMENGVILGFTDLEGISIKNASDKEVEVLEESQPKSNLVQGETTMVKEKEEEVTPEYQTNLVPGEEPFTTFNGYQPEVFVVKEGDPEYEQYLAGKKMKQEVQDIFERNGMKVDIIYDYRPHNSGIGYANDRSHHRRGAAVDIVPRDGDFEALRDFLLHNEEMVAYLKENNLGVIDEAHQSTLDHTGGPTEHFHIGPDQMAKRMYKGWQYLETYCNDVNNASSAEEIETLKQQMRDRLKSWDFREYEIQSFFEDADKMLNN